MRHEAERNPDVLAWLDKAAEDLAIAAHALDASPPFLGDALFHAQQAAEKTMKGLPAWHDVPFRKVHSLEELGEQCLQVDPGLRQLVDEVVPLTAYAWKCRYPTPEAQPELSQATKALDSARRLYRAVVASLGMTA